MNIEFKERPIPFSAAMVHAIITGRKSETRRVLKVQPPSDRCKLWLLANTTGSKKDIGKWAWHEDVERKSEYFSLPYGKPGDRLWVREGFRYLLLGGEWNIQYRADGRAWTTPVVHLRIEKKFQEYKTKNTGADESVIFERFQRWMPPMFMHRWASRIDLENTGKEVERIGNITEESAIAEGIEPLSLQLYRDYSSDWDRGVVPLVSFVSLWESINGKDSWNNNLRVLVLKFKVKEVRHG